MEKNGVSEKISDVILRAKNSPPIKSAEMVLSVCEDILCQPIDTLSASEKEMFLGVLAQYTMMKRRLSEKERKKPKSNKER